MVPKILTGEVVKMNYDKPPTCPKCAETTLQPNEQHSGLKVDRHPINGIVFLLIYCANCGVIIGVAKE